MVFERMAQRHWAKYLPVANAGPEKGGNLGERDEGSGGESSGHTSRNLVRNGAQMQAAREWVLNEYILLPPETTE